MGAVIKPSSGWSDPRGRLQSLRRAIDGVDDELRALLAWRARHALEIGAIKREQGLPVHCPDREAAVVDRLLEGNGGPLPDRELAAIMGRVIAACRGLQERGAVACLGPAGSFSQGATRDRFGENAEVMMTRTIAEVIERVADGRAARGVVPADNAKIGPIAETRQTLARHPEVRVREAFVQAIELALMVRPGTTEIREIHSKAEALAQCREHLQALAPQARLVEAASTSAAARHVSRVAAGEGVAALAAPYAAQTYGLQIRERNLADREGNTTVFWVVERPDG